MELLLGAGRNRVKKMWLDDEHREWTDLKTVDFNPQHDPDFVYDLRDTYWTFSNGNTFDEIHAYDVMEHLGQQGDFLTFFSQWSNIWYLLKPGGHFFGVSPSLWSPWLWGDPGHTRAMSRECLYFLCQPNYDEVGLTPMTDYRFCYKADFDIIRADVSQETGQFYYVLKAVKPSRIKT